MMASLAQIPAPVGGGLAMAGISASELAVMQTAAADFLDRYSTGPVSAVTVTAAMRVLREPAGPEAAGLISARRSSYAKVHGAHFMMMAHHAD
jgi:hypothetical protein